MLCDCIAPPPPPPPTHTQLRQAPLKLLLHFFPSFNPRLTLSGSLYHHTWPMESYLIMLYIVTTRETVTGMRKETSYPIQHLRTVWRTWCQLHSMSARWLLVTSWERGLPAHPSSSPLQRVSTKFSHSRAYIRVYSACVMFQLLVLNTWLSRLNCTGNICTLLTFD